MKKFVLCLFIIISTTVCAEGMHQDKDSQPATIKIPADILELLRTEMRELRKGMEQLVYHVLAAQWHEIAIVGENIQHSYIMKKALSKQQMHLLHDTLPQGFKNFDKKFHGYGGKLSLAAKAKDMELVLYYVNKLQQACSGCHSQFATQRFSGYLEAR